MGAGCGNEDGLRVCTLEAVLKALNLAEIFYSPYKYFLHFTQSRANKAKFDSADEKSSESSGDLGKVLTAEVDS